MEVKGPGRANQTGKTSKTGSTGKTSGTGGAAFDALLGTGDAPAAESTAAFSPATGVQQIDTLLALQESADSGDEGTRRRARLRANAVLESLENIRVGLLTGQLKKSTLEDLARIIKTHRENIMDPALTEVLDEIDLRAQVEIAKYEQRG